MGKPHERSDPPTSALLASREIDMSRPTMFLLASPRTSIAWDSDILSLLNHAGRIPSELVIPHRRYIEALAAETAKLSVKQHLAALGQTATPLRPIEVSVRASTQVVVGPILHLKGNVEIQTDQKLIHADEADYDVTTGELEARGNVRAAKICIPINNATLADKFQINIKTPGQCMFVFNKQDR